MARVLGVGGIFFTSPNPQGLNEWYGQWLGLDLGKQFGVAFEPAGMPPNSCTVWSAFPAETTYFAPSTKGFMINLIVDDLEQALAQVQAGGAELVGSIESYDNGRFGWFLDPDGNKIELWEPNR